MVGLKLEQNREATKKLSVSYYFWMARFDKAAHSSADFPGATGRLVGRAWIFFIVQIHRTKKDRSPPNQAQSSSLKVV
jgi:hypothetical protein